MPIILKAVISAVIIVLLTELAKKQPNLAGFLAAMPITTLLVMIWLYFDKQDANLHLSMAWLPRNTDPSQLEWGRIDFHSFADPLV
ncbi:hypothetical protein ACFL4F_03110 [Candidatus Margulisiibacteriota bacterium]